MLDSWTAMCEWAVVDFSSVLYSKQECKHLVPNSTMSWPGLSRVIQGRQSHRRWLAEVIHLAN